MSRSPNGRSDDVTPQQKSALLLLFITFFIDILGFGLVLTLSPYYVERYPHLFGLTVRPGLAVGALTACYPILQLIFAPLWGRLSDRIGRRPVILVSLLGNALAWVLFGVARSLEVLFLARILSGALSSASLPTVQAYIADSTPPSKRSVWIGIVVGMGFSFGFMLGPPIGGLLGTSPWPDWMNWIAAMLPHGQALISADHLSYPAFLAAAIAFTNFVVSYRRLPESLSPAMRARALESHSSLPLSKIARAMAEPRMGAMLLILGLSTFAMQNLEQNITLYGTTAVSRYTSMDSWSPLTPAFVSGHNVYAIRYSPDNPPPAAQIEAIQKALVTGPGQVRGVESDASIKSGAIELKRRLIQEDTGLVLFGVAFIVGMIQGGVLRKLIPRLGEVTLILVGSLIGAVGFFLVPGARTFLPLIGAASVVAIGVSFISPCLRGLISQESEAHTQGSVMGLSESVRGLAMATGPLIGGWLFDRGAWMPFALGGLCLVGCLALAARLGVRLPARSMDGES
jgi:MFS transporter, DHA1 family, tetracycline resistance protein